MPGPHKAMHGVLYPVERVTLIVHLSRAQKDGVAVTVNQIPVEYPRQNIGALQGDEFLIIPEYRLNGHDRVLTWLHESAHGRIPSFHPRPDSPLFVKYDLKPLRYLLI